MFRRDHFNSPCDPLLNITESSRSQSKSCKTYLIWQFNSGLSYDDSREKIIKGSSGCKGVQWPFWGPIWTIFTRKKCIILQHGSRDLKKNFWKKNNRCKGVQCHFGPYLDYIYDTKFIILPHRSHDLEKHFEKKKLKNNKRVQGCTVPF